MGRFSLESIASDSNKAGSANLSPHHQDLFNDHSKTSLSYRPRLPRVSLRLLQLPLLQDVGRREEESVQ